MTQYEIRFANDEIELVLGADAYEQEGQMTTFFATERQVIDSWSVRIASFRTTDIVSIRRITEAVVYEPTLGAYEINDDLLQIA